MRTFSRVFQMNWVHWHRKLREKTKRDLKRMWSFTVRKEAKQKTAASTGCGSLEGAIASGTSTLLGDPCSAAASLDPA
jgi:hypothetical protein